ncbi:MAG TPA: hypothetical protein VGM05_29380 [Planctomycetaceae bacterium]|jgi:hypothetical protein
MSRRSKESLFITACCLLLAAVPACAGFANFSISIVREQWNGLAGFVSKEGEQVKLPDSLWDIKYAAKPEGDVVIPRPIIPLVNRLPAISERLAKFDVADPVVLRIRGEKIRYERTGSRSTTIPGDHDGLYLAYSMKDTDRQLILCKKPGKDTEWKVVDGERAMSKSSGEFQYHITQTARFRLEAAHRPGWFLSVDEDHRLCLATEAPKKRVIDLDIEKRYDDLSDGK